MKLNTPNTPTAEPKPDTDTLIFPKNPIKHACLLI